jgi:hypothetical protein
MDKYNLSNALTTSGGDIAVLLVRGDYINKENYLTPSSRNTIWFSLDDKNLLNALSEKIDNIHASNATPLYDGLEIATNTLLELKNEAAYKVVLCFSDGISNRGKKNFKDVVDKVQKIQIPIFTIGYSKSSAETEELQNLKKISLESGAGDKGLGSYMYTNINDLEGLFNKVEDSIAKAYELRWKPTSSKIGEKVDVIITVHYKAKDNIFQTEIRKPYILRSFPNDQKVE